MNSKFWKITFYLLGFFPLLFIIAIISFYFHTALILGHLPIPSLDDPKKLEINEFYSPIVLTFFIAIGYSLFAWIIFSIIYFWKNRMKSFNKPFVFAGLVYLISIGIFFSEILYWYLD